MNLHFCDLCNESIPQADLDLGRAVRRNERLICAACEGAMSGNPGRPAATPVAPGTERPAAGQEAGHGSSLAAVALAFSSVSLVVGVGLGAYLYWHMEERTGKLGQGLADLERSAPEHARTVSAALAEESRARESDQAETRDVLRMLEARLQELESVGGQQASLDRKLERVEARLGTLDDLASRVQHQSGQLDQLSTTVSALSTRRAEAAPAVTTPAPQPKAQAAPAVEERGTAEWERWLGDLESPEAGTRWQAVQAIGGTHDPAVVVHLLPMLQDSDIFVRMAACRHLGDLSTVEAIPGLIDALADEEAAVREAALVALRRLSGQSIPFDPLGKEGDRAKRAKDWRDWWEKAAKDLIAREKSKS